MGEFKRKLPKKPSFSQRGLDGYKFPLKNQDVEVSFVDVKQGHDDYIVSKKCNLIYYVLEGNGTFDINGVKCEAKPRDLFEVPTDVEFTYSGKMKLLLIARPPWFEGNEDVKRKNPVVV